MDVIRQTGSMKGPLKGKSELRCDPVNMKLILKPYDVLAVHYLARYEHRIVALPLATLLLSRHYVTQKSDSSLPQLFWSIFNIVF